MMESSPPRTPEDNNRVPESTRSTPSSDESSLDVSFNYVVDEDGNLVRCSKGSSRSDGSSPPTPSDMHLPESPASSKPTQTDHLSPLARISLSRSEGAFPVLSNANVDTNGAHYTDRPPRSFQRVTSNPAPSYLAPTASSMAKPRATARRVTMEDDRERVKPTTSWSRQTLDPAAHTLQEEKENISETDDAPYLPSSLSKQRNNSPPLVTRSTSSAAPSRFAQARAAYLAGGSSSANGRPLTDLPSQRRDGQSRQILPGPNRPGRIVKSSTATTPASKYAAAHLDGEASDQDRHSPTITHNDGHDTDPDDDIPQRVSGSVAPLSSVRQRSVGNLNIAVPPLSLSVSRPRRSASLSDAAHHDDYQLQLQQQFQHPSSRPGTSMSNHGSGNGPRRATQDWDVQDAEAELNKKYRAQLEELDRLEQDQVARQSPSPTHQQSSHPTSRPAYAHKRRDSDTLRSHGQPLSATSIGSPTVMESGHRDRSSPPPATANVPSKLQARSSPSGAFVPGVRGRVSPLAKGLDRERDRASPPGRGRLSPASNGKPSVRDVPRHRRSPTAPEPAAAAAIEAKERELEREKEKERERAERDQEKEKKHSSLQAAGSSSSGQYASSSSMSAIAGQQFNRHIVVNKKAYARLDMIGKGGSSRVFRVLSHLNELYAIKRVSLDKTDAETMSGYMNEIALLKRLEGNSRIIRLIDSEVKAGPSGSKGYLMLVMECGEIDFARLLQEQMREPLNMMLQAVHVIHEEKIVHSDLKPANFVLVRGQLKLIDFGIANAIANDTTNIQRDHQIGTVNYMSPEAIELPDGMRRLKVGRPSDVWSLGCILYQMIYGCPPFQHLSVYQKMKAIPDLTHVIDFPEYSVPTAPSARSSSASNTPNANPEPPKKLEHLKQKVRKDVIRSIQDCLCRTPKERATIPQLMAHGWLSGKEEEPETPPAPTARPTLGPKESIIDPFYMQQLLKYGIQTGLAQARGEASPLSDASLEQEAERLISELRSVQCVPT